MQVNGTVAITGAGLGLGLELARVWAAGGHAVLALVYDEGHRAGLEEAVAGLPGKVDIEVVDVTRPGDFSFPDDTEVLINNAGIRLKNMPAETIEVDEWRRYMEVNFLGAVAMTNLVIPIMRRNGRGTIVNMNSASITHPIPFLGPYRAAKGAMAAYTETLRVELSQFGIRAIEFLPGAMRTGLSKTSMSTTRAEAADVPGYGPLADAFLQKMTGGGVEILEANDAAQLMMDIVLSDDGGLRYGTDQRSNDSINEWRSGGGVPLVDEYIEGFGWKPRT